MRFSFRLRHGGTGNDCKFDQNRKVDLTEIFLKSSVMNTYLIENCSTKKGYRDVHFQNDFEWNFTCSNFLSTKSVSKDISTSTHRKYWHLYKGTDIGVGLSLIRLPDLSPPAPFSPSSVLPFTVFSAPALKCRRAIAIPPASASASACKMLGQMLKSWNFSLSVFFLAF